MPLESCENCRYGFKGAPPARRPDGAGPCSRTMRGTCTEKRTSWGECRAGAAGGVGGASPQVAGSLARACSAGAHRRGAGRCPPRRCPVLCRRTHPPLRSVSRRAARAGWPVVSRQVRWSPDERSQPPGRNAAHCPGWPLRRQGHTPEDRFYPLRRNDLRDPPLSTGDLCRPSGPDGGGQARSTRRTSWFRGSRFS
jgi:hypothetical protein